MPQEVKKRIGWRTTAIGGGILLLAVLLILAAVFLPRITQKNKMTERLETVFAEEVQYILVSDPLADNGNFLGYDGIEVRLDEAEIEALRGDVRALLDAGLSFSESEKRPAGSFEMRVLVRTSEGGIAELFVTETTVSYQDGDICHRFVAKKNADTINVLYRHLTELLQKEITA